MSGHAIKHRLHNGRLHPVWRGVYAVGHPQLSPLGRWMAAVLACGPGAVLCHDSAAALWGIAVERRYAIQVSVPRVARRHPGIEVHRRRRLEGPLVTKRHGIPVTAPALTVVDFATCFGRDAVEAAINEADKLDVIDPETLRTEIERLGRRPGVAAVRWLLDRRTFRLSDSALERRMLAIFRRVGLGLPETRRYANGFRVDFFWPELGLVVEGDGLRYHRTPAQQAHDRLRDQAHTAAGLVPLRFTHGQVWYEPEHVEATLKAVVARLRPVREVSGGL